METPKTLISPSLLEKIQFFQKGVPTQEEMERVVAHQIEIDPSFGVKDLANLLSITYYKADKFFRKPHSEWREKIYKEIFELRSQGFTQEEIEENLNFKYPGARGISQTTISDILSGKRKFKKRGNSYEPKT